MAILSFFGNIIGIKDLRLLYLPIRGVWHGDEK